MTRSPAPPKVFLVEDVVLIRDNLVATLQEMLGALTVATAQTEDEAVQWLHSHPDAWDLAVVDLFLQQGSGVGVLRALEQRQAAQCAVVLTNYATPDVRERCLAAGADRVFDKSTEIETFLAYCAHPLRAVPP